MILPLPIIPLWLPAWVFIVHSLVLNALIGQLIQDRLVMVSVNVFAHLGGAAGGLLFIYFFLHPEVFAQRR
jgi:membrane associated rhomboid family serine protease